MALHGDPNPVFIKPVKDAIKATLIDSGMLFSEIDYNGIERNGRTAASITNSKVIPPVANQRSQRPNGGRVVAYRGDDGEQWVRSLRSDFILHFDVVIMSESLAESTEFLLDLIRKLPREITDHMPLMGKAIQPADEHGMPILLTVLEPLLPDENTSTAKRYLSSCVVRAEGGLYLDKQTTVRVTPKISIAGTFGTP